MADEARWEAPLLDDLARSVAFPRTPDLWPGVAAKLAAAPPVAEARPAYRRLVLAGGLAILAASALTLGLWAEAREAVADFLGLAVEGERIEVLPTPAPGATSTPLPSPVTLEQTASRISRDDAARRLGFEPVLPASLGEPRAFYAVPVATPPVVVADFGHIQVWQFPLEGGIFIGKGVPAGGGTVVAEVTVNGVPGYWIEGGPRVVEVIGRDGTPVAGTRRTVLAESLVWAQDGVYLRIEGTVSRADALALAAEMHRGN